MNSASKSPVRIAVVGLGMAGSEILRSLADYAPVQIAAVVSSRREALAAYSERFGGACYGTLEELCADTSVDGVWVASPSEYHCENALTLLKAGKHVVMEKPFAITLDECERMIAAADATGVSIIAGGSHSFNPAYLSMRQIALSGRLGGVAAMADWAFTSWMLSPREQHEVDPSRDGGELLNQGPHPVDALRLIGGGMVRSVRGRLVDTNLQGRPCAGYFTCFLEFEDGTPATLVYNGYGYIGGWELVGWGESNQRLAAAERQSEYRRKLREGLRNEDEARDLVRYGNGPGFQRGSGDWTPGSPGNIVVTCERGEIRQSPTGLYVYDDAGRHDEPFVVQGGVRTQEADELIRALRGEPIFRDGGWGMATLEVVNAIAESSRLRKEIVLQRQVPVPEGDW